ncbi:MAG: ABC transporter ATP-binding protein [Firmicutes bacterium HGW-Firmicutes-20]|nr:MAG: ABC transporter ATP-binding protein [Firmicutes bacterium HGW-Firmicutes-20]PKM70088.1 MAG: ABC transporter ATP-binding protein [Firmicutes bacterium HGW-Firmicutes-19]
MLVLKNITIKTLKGRTLLNDCSFSLNKNDRLAIIGEEGNGKSTLCKLIAGVDDIHKDFIVSGDVICDHARIGYLPQHLSDKQYQQDVFSFLIQDPTDADYDILPQFEKQMSKFDMSFQPEDYNRSLSSFSGGEKIKIQMAKLLTEDPLVLVLDEPTNDLDLDALRWLEDFILKSSIPLIYVSHDSVLLAKTANRILHLEQTQRKQVPLWTLESIGFEEYLAKRTHRIQRQESLAKKQKSEMDAQMEKWRQIYQKVEHRQNTISRQDPHGGQLLKKKMKNVKAVKRRIDKVEKIKNPDPEEAVEIFFDQVESMPSSKVIFSDQLESLYIGKRLLSSNLHLQIVGPARIGIFGSNGCGKSTYLRYIDQKMSELNVSHYMMVQDYSEKLDVTKSAVDFLTKDKTKEEKSEIMTYLGSLKFTEQEMISPIESLSLGQRAKVILVDMVRSKVDCLILDEPTRNLSPLTMPVVESMFKQFHGAILAVSHDRHFLTHVCDKHYLFTQEGLRFIENFDIN